MPTSRLSTRMKASWSAPPNPNPNRAIRRSRGWSSRAGSRRRSCAAPWSMMAGKSWARRRVDTCAGRSLLAAHLPELGGQRPGFVFELLASLLADALRLFLVRKSSAFGFGLVQGHGGANESLQRLLVDLLALVEVDGSPCVALETGVEEARRIVEGRAFGEGHLHHALVGLACADQSVVRPHRNPSPLPLLDDVGIGFLDQGTEPAEHVAAPVAQLLDSRVDQLRRRLTLLRPALLHACFSFLSQGFDAQMR